MTYFFNLFILLHCKQKGYNLFLRLYMQQQSCTICVIIHVHRVMIFVSFCYFSSPPSLPPLFFIYTIHTFSTLASRQPQVMYRHLLIREIIQSLFYWDWLISLSMILSNIFTANAIILFFFMTNIPLCLYTAVSLFIHQLRGIQVGSTIQLL